MQFNVVERIMIERFATETNETNAGGRAFVGALIGGVVGVPTAGAVIGAAGGKVQRNIRPGFICQFTVRYNNTLYRYSGTYTFGWKPDPGVLACATLRDGDQIRIFTNVQEDTLREKILSSAVYWQAGVSEEVPLR